MKIFLIGSGGREHALVWKLTQSANVKKIYCAPGNAGIAQCAQCVDIAADDLDALVKFATDNKIDLAVIGPEAPLTAGLADILRAAGIAVFGPSAAAARLEGSKGFMKDLCRKYGVPTAAYGRFIRIDDAAEFIEKHGVPIVVKTDGLAAGKGVIIAQTEKEAIAAAAAMLSGDSFGDAGCSIVIEEFLEGEEISFFALCDGKTYIPFGSARDHKRAFDNDEGPNTGGMGVISPAPALTPALQGKIEECIIKPAIEGMTAEGCPFTGVLFAGIMVARGEPILLEFNVRFGDPECQALMMRFDGDLTEILLACAQGRLDSVENKVQWLEDPAVCVVMAARGYPGAFEKGSIIEGVNQAGASEDAIVFHAATARDTAGRLISAGGRVLGVTARGKDADRARAAAYEAVDRISWPGGFCRRDIGMPRQDYENKAAKKSTSC